MAEVKDLPMDKGKWKECRIIEDRGEHDEHDDQFYRYGDFGIEACRHGMPDMDPEYETYVIVGDVPYRVEGCHCSFEEAVGALMHASQAKRVDGGKWDEEDGDPEDEKDEKDDDKDDKDDDEDGKKGRMEPFDGGATVMTVDLEEIAKSSISDMISRNRENRKAPQKVEIEDTMPPMAEGQTRTPRSMLRTVVIGAGKDRAMPKDVKVHDGAEGSTRRKA